MSGARRGSIALGALAVFAALAVRAERAAGSPPALEIVLDRDDIDVTTDVVVKPGVYRVRDLDGDGVLRVKADGVTVTMTGVVLDGATEGETPERFDGVGVSIVGAYDVAIVGGTIRGYRVGVRGEGAKRLELSEIDVSGSRCMRLKSTPEREDASDWLWPHENDDGQWEKNYGAGISLTRCRKARVGGCRGHAGQNGVLLSRCDGSAVIFCDFSFNSGWGIALWRTSECTVSGNRCDWCVRGYSHGVYARGQDSAGILVFEQCSKNRFTANSATHSGDGFFLYAGNETLRKTGKGGCNGNQVIGCDFSHAVANGIEATFSSGNLFGLNRLDECDHGIWAGYSYDSSFGNNTAERCANGISIEHGHGNLIHSNVLTECGTGVHLWWNENKELAESPFGKANGVASSRNSLSGNRILGGVTGLDLDSDLETAIGSNRIEGAKTAIRIRGKARGIAMGGNDVLPAPEGISLRNETGSELVFALANWWGAAGPRFSGSPVSAPDLAPAEFPLAAANHPHESTLGEPPFLPKDAPRGRKYILIDEWGPIDPKVPRLFPAAQSATGAAALSVLGVGVPWRVVEVSPGFVVDPAAGTAPAVFRVRRAKDATGPSYAPFEVEVNVGETPLVARGTLLSARWKVSWFGWTKDPREDTAAWKALVAGPPLDTAETDGLDFAWGSGKPAEHVPADRFATVAETTVTLPAGRWKVSTLSDDGIRVFVDGKVVLEDWTWHGPKEVDAVVDLAAGDHAIRVEHFELDGHAALRCTVEPVAPK